MIFQVAPHEPIDAVAAVQPRDGDVEAFDAAFEFREADDPIFAPPIEPGQRIAHDRAEHDLRLAAESAVVS